MHWVAHWLVGPLLLRLQQVEHGEQVAPYSPCCRQLRWRQTAAAAARLPASAAAAQAAHTRVAAPAAKPAATAAVAAAAWPPGKGLQEAMAADAPAALSGQQSAAVQQAGELLGPQGW